MLSATVALVAGTSVGPESAAVLLTSWVLYEVYAPSVLDHQTALAPLFELPDRVEHLEERQAEIHDALEEQQQLQVQHIQVSRANARVLDEAKQRESVNADRVDQYLVRNGVPVDELLRTESETTDAETDDLSPNR